MRISFVFLNDSIKNLKIINIQLKNSDADDIWWAASCSGIWKSDNNRIILVVNDFKLTSAARMPLASMPTPPLFDIKMTYILSINQIF